MRTVDLLSSAVRNTFRSKLRTTLTVLALAVGAFTLTLTTAVGAGVTDYVTTQVATLGADDVFIVSGSTATGSTDGPQKYDPTTSTASTGTGGGALPGAGQNDPLTDADLRTIRGYDGITTVRPIRLAAVDYAVGPSASKYEITLAPTASIARSDLEAGEQLSGDSARRELVLPSDYVKPLGFGSAADAVGATVTLGLTDVLGQKHTVDATVVGISRDSLLASGAGANPALTDELANLQAAGVDTGPSRYPIAIASFDRTLSTDRVDALKGELVAAGYAAQTVQDQLGVIKTVIDAIVGVLNAFAVVALIAAAFGIVNTLLMSVQERTREIGLMKAMGMRSSRVFTLFSLEAAFIGLLGSAVGAVLAIAVGSVVNGALAAGPLSALPGLSILLFNPVSVIGIILLIMAIAFGAGTLPARRAARKTPIESLRYE